MIAGHCRSCTCLAPMAPTDVLSIAVKGLERRWDGREKPGTTLVIEWSCNRRMFRTPYVERVGIW